MHQFWDGCSFVLEGEKIIMIVEAKQYSIIMLYMGRSTEIICYTYWCYTELWAKFGFCH
jgi:hypothetical protein